MKKLNYVKLCVKNNGNDVDILIFEKENCPYHFAAAEYIDLSTAKLKTCKNGRIEFDFSPDEREQLRSMDKAMSWGCFLENIEKPLIRNNLYGSYRSFKKSTRQMKAELLKELQKRVNKETESIKNQLELCRKKDKTIVKILDDLSK